MIASPARIEQVRIGRVAPLGPGATPSGYVKRPASAAVWARADGLDGDEQGDRTVHGGPDKAVYSYPVSGYAGWAAQFPRLADRLGPGMMGENLAIDGADERGVHIGDRVRAGAALLQMTQIRQPCFKLGLALGEPRAVAAMVRSGRCGWYYRVVEAGPIGAGDVHIVIDRPNPEWPVSRLAQVVAARAFGRAILSEMVAVEGLAETWRLKALRQLAELRDAGR